MNVLVLWERNLTSVQGDVDATLIAKKRSAIGACADDGFTGKIGVCIFTVQGCVLNVGVSKGCDFISGLEFVGIGVVVVVLLVGLTDGETPARRGGTRNGLIHTLDPPREELPFGEVVGKSERGVGDFRVFPRTELVDSRFVGDGHDVSGRTTDGRPSECWLR